MLPTEFPSEFASEFEHWAHGIQSRMEEALATHLPGAEIAPQRLHEAMRYAALGGGKRVRPLLAFGAGEVAGANADRVAVVASAVELIHAYSLVHDDMPCMDDDVLRRGKPTVHVEFDEATALLVGDSLQSLAFQLLAQYPLADDPHKQLEMVTLLAVASGSRGMAGGQAIDLAAIGMTLTVEELEFMHIHKTGALMRAAVLLGAHAGNADAATLQGLGHFASRAGLLFQVVDDILDAEGSTITLGKTAGKDAVQDKPTYVSMLGCARAKELAERLHAEARAALKLCAGDTARLASLTDYIAERSF